jgi:hypothetical protein
LRASAGSTFFQSPYPPTRASETIAFMPAAWIASSCLTAANPATVIPHSRIFLSAAGSSGG